MEEIVRGDLTPSVPQPCSTLVPGVLLELLGGCLVLFASRSAVLDWVPALGQARETPAGSVLATASFTALVAGIALMLLGYLVSLRAAGRVRPSLGTTLAATVLLAAPLLVLITIPSDNINNYALGGRIDALYGGNPYTDPPAEFQRDLFARQSRDQAAVSDYGPAWQTSARVIAQAAGEEAGPARFAVIYRLLGLATLLVSSGLIWAILGRLHPAEQARGTWLFATNPLCLVELVGSGHHDGLMMLLILLGVLVQLRGRTVTAVVCFGLAVLTKWIVLILVPAYLVWIYRGRGFRRRATRSLLLGTLLVVMLGAGLYGRYWAGMRTVEAVTGNLAATRFGNSLAEWVRQRIDPASTRSVSPPGVHSPTERRIIWAFSLAFAAWALALLRQVHDVRTLLAAWGWTLFAYVCLASVWFWPPYGIWVLALAALAPGTSLVRAAVLLSATAMLITIGRAAHVAISASIDSFLLPTFLPPLAYAALSYLRHRLLAPPVSRAPAGVRR